MLENQIEMHQALCDIANDLSQNMDVDYFRDQIK